MGKKWRCDNWTEETDIEHETIACDCTSGCGGSLCLTCCETEMFGEDDD